MSYVYQYLKFTFTVVLFSRAQSSYAFISIFGYVPGLFDDESLIGDTDYNFGSLLKYAHNIDGYFQYPGERSVEIQMCI